MKKGGTFLFVGGMLIMIGAILFIVVMMGAIPYSTSPIVNGLSDDEFYLILANALIWPGLIWVIIGAVVRSRANREDTNYRINQMNGMVGMNSSCPVCGLALVPGTSICPSCHTAIGGQLSGNGGILNQFGGKTANNDVRYCIYCGNQVRAGAAFCDACGKPV